MEVLCDEILLICVGQLFALQGSWLYLEPSAESLTQPWALARQVWGNATLQAKLQSQIIARYLGQISLWTWWWFFPTMHVLPLLAWMLYLTTGNHDLFAALFTVQVPPVRRNQPT
eukprot:6464832-Amphidinium_carterae.1